jgi:N-dimethylarginine dimethylaminohydrolase
VTSVPIIPGADSDTGTITRVLLRRPADAFVSQENIDSQWRNLNYAAAPDYDRAAEEYEGFVELLTSAGAEPLFLRPDEALTIDSIYVRDSMVVTPAGVILCRMGKKDREGEPEVAGSFLKEAGIRILGRIEGEGRLEGGDLIWLDQKTIVVGLGYRTNAEGIHQLQALTESLIDEIIVVPLPHWNGPSDVMHLMSNISPIDNDLALVYSRLLTVPFRQALVDRGVKLIEVPDDEYESMACNVLAIAPRKCVMIEGNPETRRRLEKAQVEVLVYEGNEISRKGAGGPTCLTRPLERTL